MKALRLNRKLGFRIVLSVFVGLFALSACDSSNALLETGASSDANLAPSVANLSTQLNLTESQSQDINDVLTKRGSENPGTLWYVAAELQHTLTAGQKEELLASIKEAATASRGNQGEGKGRFGDRKAHFEGVVGDLSDGQKEQLKAFHEKQREGMEALITQRREGTLTEEEMKDSMKMLRESASEELKAILTEEQWGKLEAAREERGEERAERRGSRFGGEKGQRMRGLRGSGGNGVSEEMRESFSAAKNEALGLTTEQQEEIKVAMEAQKEKGQALFEELRASGGDREALKEKMEAFRNESRDAMAEILTEDQLETISIHRALAFKARKEHAGEAAPGRRGQRRFNRQDQ